MAILKGIADIASLTLLCLDSQMQLPVAIETAISGVLETSHMARFKHQAHAILSGPAHVVALRKPEFYMSFEAAQKAQFGLHESFMQKTNPVGSPCLLPNIRQDFSEKGMGRYYLVFSAFIKRTAGYPLGYNEEHAQNSPFLFYDECKNSAESYKGKAAKRVKKVLGKTYKYRGILETRYADYLKLPQYSIIRRGENFHFVLTYYRLTKIKAAMPVQLELEAHQSADVIGIQVPGANAPILEHSTMLIDVDEGSGRRMGA